VCATEYVARATPLTLMMPLCAGRLGVFSQWQGRNPRPKSRPRLRKQAQGRKNLSAAKPNSVYSH
jgi:hypothetical protein